AVSKERPTSTLTKFIQPSAKLQHKSETSAATAEATAAPTSTKKPKAERKKTKKDRKQKPPKMKAPEKDSDSLTSEESIHLPPDTRQRAPTPPPTCDDTPAALLERLRRTEDLNG
uniref:AF4/FMR2 family, member 2 n=1 Tax=Macrostomum lignano TaxID=282301 RepID=A0A1I8HQD9_9PLAT